ncbi:MAG: helix-turn-helix transcriptional regulator [Candidatus Carbobacillus sp.]|nr:helix-turn-helix transcriptional regulator [Candidatus Carbobacillus sp.]
MNELAQHVKQLVKDDPLYTSEIDDSIEKRVAYHVKRLRKLQKMTQADLAHHMGVKQPFIARIESGKNNISIRKLEEIAHVLKLDPSVLVAPIYALGYPEDVVRFVINKRYRIMAINPGGVKYFGRPQLELVHTLLAHDNPFRKAAEKAYASGKTETYVTEELLIEARPILNSRDHVIGMELTAPLKSSSEGRFSEMPAKAQ